MLYYVLCTSQLSNTIRSILNTFACATINTSALDVIFFNIINLVKEEDMKFMRQSQTIKMTNVVIKYCLKKKYASMETCYRFLYAESSSQLHQTVVK